MEAVIKLLTPQQIEAILSTYSSLEAWFAATASQIGHTASSIVVEDIMI